MKRRALVHTVVAVALMLVMPVAAGCAGRSQVILVRGFPEMSRPPNFVKSWPPYGVTLESPPGVVTVELSQPVTSDSVMSVFLDGRQVDGRDASVMIGSDDKLQVSMKGLPGKGMYRVDYTVVWRSGGSAEGRFYFLTRRSAR